MDKDEEIDRNYVRGLMAGWNMGTAAGYLTGKMDFAIMSDKQRQLHSKELEEITKEYSLCIENRMKFCREDRDE